MIVADILGAMTGTELKSQLHELPPGPLTVPVAEKVAVEVLRTDFAMLSPSGQTLAVYNVRGALNLIDVDSTTRILRRAPASKVWRNPKP